MHASDALLVREWIVGAGTDVFLSTVTGERQETSVLAVKEANMFCERCGAELEADARFCSACGHQVGTESGDKEMKTYYFFKHKNKIIQLILFVGFLSAIQAFSFEHLDRVECHYYADESNMMDCLRDLNSHVGEVVVLDWDTYVGSEIPSSNPEWKRRRPFERRIEQNYVGWHFEGCTFAQEINRSCTVKCNMTTGVCTNNDWESTTRILDAKFSRGRTTWADLPLPDNGLSVRIQGNGQSANPYSSFEIETEGLDIAQGPFQISMSNRDANFILWLSPAPMTDSLASQVRCARRDWPYLLKFFVCPFV